MVAARKQEDGEKRKEVGKEWSSFAGQVAVSLLESVHNGGRAEEVLRAVGTAERLAEAIRLRPEYKDVSKPANQEKTILLLAIAHALNAGVIQSEEIGLAILGNLFKSTEIKANVAAEKGLLKGVRKLILQGLLSEAGLLTGKVSPKEAEALRRRYPDDVRYQESVASLRVDRSLAEYVQRTGEKIIRLPFREREAMDFARRLQARYTKRPMHGFAGLSIRYTQSENKTDKVVLVFSDTPKKVERHESIHLNNPGVRINQFFCGMNEGMTERETRKRSSTAEKLMAIMRNPASKSIYEVEIEFVNLLDSLGLEDVLQGRFTQGATEKTVRDMYAKIIDRFGLSGLLLIAQAFPEGEAADSAWLRKNGLRSTREVIGILKRQLKT